MDRRTTGIVLTIVAVLLCGLPGLLSACLGVFMAVISYIPGAQIDVFGNSDPQSATRFGGGALCLGLVLILIPLLVGVITLRRQPAVAKGPGTPMYPPPPPPVQPPTATITSPPPAEPPTRGGATIYTTPEPPNPPDEPIPPAI